MLRKVSPAGPEGAESETDPQPGTSASIAAKEAIGPMSARRAIGPTNATAVAGRVM